MGTTVHYFTHSYQEYPILRNQYHPSDQLITGISLKGVKFFLITFFEFHEILEKCHK